MRRGAGGIEPQRRRGRVERGGPFLEADVGPGDQQPQRGVLLAGGDPPAQQAERHAVPPGAEQQLHPLGEQVRRGAHSSFRFFIQARSSA
ncbi:MAG TPA: hypothetical protein VNP92_24690 [Actinophytocola sp.]|nr:hypothetical protein [Actinophytocola sp.]